MRVGEMEMRDERLKMVKAYMRLVVVAICVAGYAQQAFADLIVTGTRVSGYVDAADVKNFSDGSLTNFRFGRDVSGQVTRDGVLYDEQGYYDNADLSEAATLRVTAYGLVDSPFPNPVSALSADLSISTQLVDKTNTTSTILALSGGRFSFEFDVDQTRNYRLDYSISRYSYQAGYSILAMANDARVSLSLVDTTSGLAIFSESLDSPGLHGDEMASAISKVELQGGHSYHLIGSFTSFAGLGYDLVGNSAPGATRSSGASARFHLSALPEPGSVVLLGLGAAAVGSFRRRGRSTKAQPSVLSVGLD